MNVFYKIFILIFLNGFISIITQIILYREILSQVYANEIVICFALSAWLIAGAIAGILVFPKYFKHKKDDFLFAGLIFSGFFSILVAIFSLLIIRNIKALINIPAEQIMNIWDAVIITLLIYGPAAFILTLSFGFAGEIIKRTSGDLKLLFVIETTGAIVAGVLFTLFIAGKNSNIDILYWIGIISLAASYILYRGKENVNKIVNLILIFVLIFYLIPLFTGHLKKIDENSINNQYKKYKIVAKKDGVDSRVVITQKNDEYFVFSNGLLKYQSKDPGNVEIFSFAMLSRKVINEILLVNGGYTGGINEIRRYSQAKITVLETDLDTAELLEKEYKGKADWQNVEFVHGDLIFFLYNLDKNKKYDLVILNLPSPNTFLNNRFFTYEFYKLLKKYLNKKSVFVFSFPFSENYVGEEIFKPVASVYNTVKSNFSYVEIVAGEKIIFLASDEIIDLNKERIIQDLISKNIKIPELNSTYLEEKFRKSVLLTEKIKNTNSKINRIFDPQAYLLNIKKELMMFAKNINFIKISAVLFIFIFVLYGLIKLNLNKKNIFSYFSMLIFSLTCMMLELGLILIYQSFYGYLYRSIGLLYSFFMVGVLVGAIVIMILRNLNFKSAILTAEILNVLVLIYVLNFSNINQPVNPNIIIFFVVMSGFLTGWIFNLMLNDAELSVLYGADLAGGAIGGVLYGLIIFPLIGFAGIIIVNLLLLAILYVGNLRNE